MLCGMIFSVFWFYKNMNALKKGFSVKFTVLCDIKFVIATAVMVLSLGRASADGLRLVNGRYPGPVVVFELSVAQRNVIARFNKCHLSRFRVMNVYTPYVFELEKSQRAQLRKKKGFAPRYFEVYATYTGFNEAGPHWNLALQYEVGKIEIPLDLLLRDRAAKAAHRVQGWRVHNPCFPKVGRR